MYAARYACQHAMIPIVRELKDPTPRRKALVAMGAMGIALTMFLIVGICGYLTFGSTVDSDILLSYPTSVIVNVCRVGIIIDVLTSYPLLMFVTRISIKNLLGTCGFAGNNVTGKPSGCCAFWRDNFITSRMDFIATSIIAIFTVSIALLVSDLGIIAALTGATGATAIGYICPGFLYVALTRCRTGEDEEGRDLKEKLVDDRADGIEKLVVGSSSRKGAKALFGLGCILVPAGVALVLTE
jgi:amino acid permease